MPNVYTGQGTRNSDLPPWMSYDAEMHEELSPDLEKAVAEYAERAYDKDQTSSETKDELARQREINNELSEQYQWLSPDEYKEVAPRIGRVMHSDFFLQQLRKVSGQSGPTFFYRDHPQPGKLTLLYQRTGLEPLVACWVQAGFMPEYSIMRFDDHGVPLDERRRGWRTCLLQIILQRLLEERDVHHVFGEAQGPASDRYLRTLYSVRNRSSQSEQ